MSCEGHAYAADLDGHHCHSTRRSNWFRSQLRQQTFYVLLVRPGMISVNRTVPSTPYFFDALFFALFKFNVWFAFTAAIICSTTSLTVTTAPPSRIYHSFVFASREVTTAPTSASFTEDADVSASRSWCFDASAANPPSSSWSRVPLFTERSKPALRCECSRGHRMNAGSLSSSSSSSSFEWTSSSHSPRAQSDVSRLCGAKCVRFLIILLYLSEFRAFVLARTTRALALVHRKEDVQKGRTRIKERDVGRVLFGTTDIGQSRPRNHLR